MKKLKLKKIVLGTMLFVGLSLSVCFGQSVQAFAAVDGQSIEIQKENNLDFWGDKNALNNIPDFNYTKTGIHIKTTEHILDTVKTSTDCDTLAQQSLNGFKEKNGVPFKRSLQSVSNEIYFHVQMEKYARINNKPEIHSHTNIIDMEQDETEYDSLIDPQMTDLLTNQNISSDYEMFIKLL
jgi:hypothetical protein